MSFDPEKVERIEFRDSWRDPNMGEYVAADDYDALLALWRSRWISVEDRLPEDKQVCIVWRRRGGNAVVARYVGGRDFHDFFKNWVEVDRWMPMPEVPQS